ncbi:family 43 glycosylhydrolase [Desulfurococcaceae archaeon MEX13E-LK6-19]|nr:family 43 glycosylhydrolase [Desulfurococcaceae archaeon MEX13E-LK6-19]
MKPGIILIVFMIIVYVMSSSFFISEVLLPESRTTHLDTDFLNRLVKLSRPVLKPSGKGFDAKAVYNPAVVYVNGTFYLFYRAQKAWHGTSVIMLAVSRDGVNFVRLNLTVLYPTLREEMGGGCEDPRIVKVNNTYYMTYTAYDGVTARLALARSRDLIHWEKLGVVFPDWGWSKSGAILPVKINGKYVMYFGDSNIWIAYSDDMVHWVTSRDWVVLRPRPGYFDSKLVEPGPPPILTDEGILLIYNAADENNRYSVGWVLFSKDDPTKVIARSEKPILEPEFEWEIYGQVPNVVFATSLVMVNDRLYLYYGAADTYVGLAVASLETLFNESTTSAEVYTGGGTVFANIVAVFLVGFVLGVVVGLTARRYLR